MLSCPCFSRGTVVMFVSRSNEQTKNFNVALCQRETIAVCFCIRSLYYAGEDFVLERFSCGGYCKTFAITTELI